MRVRGGTGRVRRFAGVGLLILALAACSSRSGQPNQYELGAAAAPGGIEDFAAQAGDVIYFQTESAVLSRDAKATLRKQIRWLNAHPGYRVTVEGHADEWGTRQHNLELGAQRAIAVKAFLMQNGLRDRRIHTVSYGKERLVADCTEISCRNRNRRARTVVSPDTAAGG